MITNGNKSVVRVGLMLLLAMFCTTVCSAAPRKVMANSTAPAWDGFGTTVNLRGGVFSAKGTTLYQFDPIAAAGLYDNSFNGTVECTDSVGAACSIAQAPPAPAPDPSRASDTATNRACTFLQGGWLSSSTYSRPVNAAPYLYTYHYTLQPRFTMVAPLTYWNALPAQNGNKTPGIVVQGEIINEAVTMLDASTPSFSFPAENLVTGLHLYVDGQATKVSTIVAENCAGCTAGQPGSVDFRFASSNGTGNAMYFLRSGDARTILNSDADPNNDNGGANGALLEEMLLQSAPVQLAPGSHSLMLTGSSNNIPFSVGGSVQVLDASCPLY